jgi:pantetheine-phosphate adenylyltransferase
LVLAFDILHAGGATWPLLQVEAGLHGFFIESRFCCYLSGDSEFRVDLLGEVYRDDPRVECTSFSGLLMDFAREKGAHCIIRGLRAVSDFEYEMQMAQMNRELWPEVETVFLTPDAPLSFLSASLVREVAELGGDVSSFVSPKVLEAMKKKLAEG